jgi:calmodulin
MEEISAKKIKEYRDAFELFDRDKDGSIGKEELGQVMKCLTVGDNESIVKDIIAELDVDGNNKIDFEEFVLIMHRRSKELNNPHDLKNAFKIFDKDHDKKISNSELREIMAMLGDQLSEEEVEEIIKEADHDEDGMIDYEEFVDFILNNN